MVHDGAEEVRAQDSRHGNRLRRRRAEHLGQCVDVAGHEDLLVEQFFELVDGDQQLPGVLHVQDACGDLSDPMAGDFVCHHGAVCELLRSEDFPQPDGSTSVVRCSSATTCASR